MAVLGASFVAQGRAVLAYSFSLPLLDATRTCDIDVTFLFLGAEMKARTLHAMRVVWFSFSQSNESLRQQDSTFKSLSHRDRVSTNPASRAP